MSKRFLVVLSCIHVSLFEGTLTFCLCKGTPKGPLTMFGQKKENDTDRYSVYDIRI